MKFIIFELEETNNLKKFVAWQENPSSKDVCPVG